MLGLSACLLLVWLPLLWSRRSSSSRTCVDCALPVATPSESVTVYRCHLLFLHCLRYSRSGAVAGPLQSSLLRNEAI